MKSPDPPAGTAGRVAHWALRKAGHVARWALRNLLKVLGFLLAVTATAIVHAALEPHLNQVLPRTGLWLLLLVVIALMIAYILRKIA